METLKKILISGSSGMLGRALIEKLNPYYEVIGLDINNATGLRNFLKIDITDATAVCGALDDIKPDIAIHTAAYTNVDECEKNPDIAQAVNAAGTKNIALACKDAIFIHISTDYVFDGKLNRPYRENDTVNPISVYGKTKLLAEEYVQKHLKKYLILRTAWLYGKGGKSFVESILNAAKTQNRLRVVDDQFGTPTYADDLADAIKAALGRGGDNFGIYHLTNAGSASRFDFAREILHISNINNVEVVPINSDEIAKIRPAKRPLNSVLDNTKFIEKFNYIPRKWEHALKEYLTC